MAETKNGSEILSAAETMQLLGIKRSKLYQLIRAGYLDYADDSIKERKTPIFYRAQVEYLKQNPPRKSRPRQAS
jgi:predicted site-specific integrase-resolvase